MGYDDNTPLTGVTGGGLPAEIWHEVMVRVHEGLPPARCRCSSPNRAFPRRRRRTPSAPAQPQPTADKPDMAENILREVLGALELSGKSEQREHPALVRSTRPQILRPAHRCCRPARRASSRSRSARRQQVHTFDDDVEEQRPSRLVGDVPAHIERRLALQEGRRDHLGVALDRARALDLDLAADELAEPPPVLARDVALVGLA